MKDILDFKQNKKQLFFIFAMIVFMLPGCDRLLETKEKTSKATKKMPAPMTVQNEIPQKISEVEKSSQTPEIKMSANTLARVGSWMITIEQFNERLSALKEVVPDFDVSNIESKELVLEELLRQQLIVVDAETSGIAQDKNIQDAVEEFRRTLIVREVARKLTEGISISESEMMSFYEENKNELIEPTDYSVSEIVVDTQLKANEILIEILKGVSFAEMAKEHSQSDSASKGGDLGILKEVFFPDMGEELLTMDEGQVSKVLKGPNDQFYIFKLDTKSGGNQIAFDAIKEKIQENRLLNKQQKIILDHIESLKNKIIIETNKDLLIKG